MNSRAVEIGVGFFVAVGLAALVVLAFKVSNITGFAGQGGYELTARFENVGGLTNGAPVRIGGVRIGQVTQVGYDEQSYQAVVTMNIENKYNHLPDDTSASIYTEGLLGQQFIALSPGADTTYLKNGDQIHETQSALVLEQMLGQYLFGKAGTSSSGGGPIPQPASPIPK